MAAVAVHVESISKKFSHPIKGEVYAARNVSLSVQPGEFLTLLGPSGCGKTTTLRMIAGFEKPDTGRILFGDQEVTPLSANRRNIGFVFQNYALFPHLTVYGNIAYGLQVRGLSSQDIQREVRAVLELVGLPGFERQFPTQMSGGEQQRVAVARAIVIRPQVLLFDEPLSNLDAKLRVQMRTEIRQLQRRLSITTIYVTHDQEEAMAVSDRICVMNSGQIVQVGSAEDLYYRPQNPFVAQFIGRVNMLKGQIQGVKGDRIEVKVLETTLSLSNTLKQAKVGQEISLVLRPESIQLVPSPTTTLHGKILSRTFLGEKAEYLVDCQGTVLQVLNIDRGPKPTVKEGTEVVV